MHIISQPPVRALGTRHEHLHALGAGRLIQVGDRGKTNPPSGGFVRGELFRVPGVPSEPTAKPGPTSSPLLTVAVNLAAETLEFNTSA